ncbi:glycosyltransferase family 2 protein [Nitrospirillum sp. BR 11164]|uniref:glycosyltransferase family 2 protein n=1 Tax=Nitrospirillum sp. BR 11164 TaxID=3104324 RepID=UPI002AFEFC0D|nr:glycosyltransferase family 2 protein [Nitrospirillum sp. BR 11164]MEA1648328.1 glycosyltransferase family 2 protein [Nitrospirillum sp. BR 11164]
MTTAAPPTVIITMAGMGQRFRDAGYTVPKYRIEAHGRTLFAWSMLSLRSFIAAGSPFIFVALRQDGAEDFIRAQAAALGIRDVALVELDALTDGQATSALAARDAVAHPDRPMLVYNIDTHVDPAHLPADAVRGDGWVPCFPGPGAAWSFARADETGRIAELREKERISDDATVGLYWFSSFTLYARSYAAFFADPANMAKGEKYIAPLYNHLIRAGLPVYLHRMPFEAVVPLGTPAEVARFLAAVPPVL